MSKQVEIKQGGQQNTEVFLQSQQKLQIQSLRFLKPLASYTTFSQIMTCSNGNNGIDFNQFMAIYI